jgi:hypothetical protein
MQICAYSNSPRSTRINNQLVVQPILQYIGHLGSGNYSNTMEVVVISKKVKSIVEGLPAHLDGLHVQLVQPLLLEPLEQVLHHHQLPRLIKAYLWPRWVKKHCRRPRSWKVEKLLPTWSPQKKSGAGTSCSTGRSSFQKSFFMASSCLACRSCKGGFKRYPLLR